MKNRAEARKRMKTMRGLMCQSTATMVGCIVDDPHRSVFLPPRKPCVSRNPGVEDDSSRTRLVPRDQSRVTKMLSPRPNDVFQVVVMRVSIHCQGCAGKVKKHLSKMDGVKWFSIDLETKMVMVQGNVSPMELLESVSKIKKAEFWHL
ncbi:PREDICTED: protein SODIUM POTASSIUM ROOT DEFECTIVE 2-like [Tarenaya hassleriana]|uniref:protein SODIUM POTASSIUM ROOT DEFECTIVE 2-like n=1 Tax=Tarenaya hassleriana TaxID=28532 RepID=UPI00053C817D|nr:PREDICTED: protein SODIUM POTASSIUM ROOT DEFECTIVE 2-like [Tarenaya hassleriana]